MGFGIGLFLIAVGAILKWAVTLDVSGVELSTIGVILMVVGVAWFVIAAAMYANSRSGSVVTRRRVVEDPRGRPDEQVIEERRTYTDPPETY